MRVIVFACLWAIAPAALASDACPKRFSEDDIAARLGDATTAYIDLRTEAFVEGVEGVLLDLPCVDGVLEPATAASLHRLVGILSFTRRDEAATEASLRAARWLDPTYTFDDALLPPKHALRVSYEGLEIHDPVVQPLPKPRFGTIFLDGNPTRARAVDRATLFQRTTPDGPAAQTAYLLPGDAVPTYAVRARTRNALAIASASLAVGAGAMYGGAWATRAQFDATPASQTDDLKNLQTATNGLTGTAIGLATAALANAIAAIAVGKR